VQSVDGEKAQVETSLRAFTGVTHGWTPKTGDRVLVSIRPESWRLGTEASSMNAISGKIRERVYLGEMAQYKFAAGEQSVKVYELNPRFAFVSAETEIYASVGAEDVVLLPWEAGVTKTTENSAKKV
jgi:ABC-type Fe3+/spermidine/putrescine transport system ATPase subunit